jgi:hypothetical protein
MGVDVSVLFVPRKVDLALQMKAVEASFEIELPTNLVLQERLSQPGSSGEFRRMIFQAQCSSVCCWNDLSTSSATATARH